MGRLTCKAWTAKLHSSSHAKYSVQRRVCYVHRDVKDISIISSCGSLTSTLNCCSSPSTAHKIHSKNCAHKQFNPLLLFSVNKTIMTRIYSFWLLLLIVNKKAKNKRRNKSLWSQWVGNIRGRQTVVTSRDIIIIISYHSGRLGSRCLLL